MAVQVQESKSLWDTPISAIIAVNWEKVMLVVLILLAIGTRFWDLGARSYNHDESIHTSESYDLYVGKGYIHNPIFHGPLLYHLTAATFFLFGDNDVTGRVPNVLFGIVLVTLPYLFRKWLGPRGWIVTSLLLLISPVVTYYSRFNRHDIYVEVFVVLMLLIIMKYFDARSSEVTSPDQPRRSDRWLIAAAAVLGFSFTAMETTFIFISLFAYFLTAVFALEWLRHIRPDDDVFNHIVVAAIFGLPIFALYLAYVTVVRILNLVDRERPRQEPWHDSAAFDMSVVLGTLSLPMVLTPLFISVVLRRDPLDYSSTGAVSTGAAVLIAAIILSAVFGLVWRWRIWLSGAILFYAVTVFFFTTVFTNPGGLGTGFIGSLGYWLSQQGVQRGSQPPYYYLMVTLPMYEYLPYLFGILGLCYILLRQGSRRLAYFLFITLSSLGVVAYIWFTPGVLTGLTQLPAVFNGGDTLQAGNKVVLPLVVILVPLFFVLSFSRDDLRTRFPTIIGIWTIGVLLLFSWAGEKMPWLTMHLTIPLAFVSGYFMQRVLSADWRALYQRGALFFGLLLALVLLTLAMVFIVGAPALNTGNQQIDQLAATSGRILSILVVVLCAGGLFYIAQALGVRDTLRTILVSIFVILALFTVHSTALAAYQNSDLAIETIIYAQGTPDVPNAMREIDELSRRLCAQAVPDNKVKINCDNDTIKVAYDDDSSWPFVWYLRNYRNQQFYGKSPGAPFDAEVVIVGSANESAVKPFLGNKYVKRSMRLIWWPDESYKDLTWTKLFGGKDQDGNSVQGVLRGDNFRSLVRDVWFYHKYPTSLSSWPYVHQFSMYVRRDIASTLWQYAGVVAPPAASTEEDLYVKNFRTNVQAVSAIGSEGVADGQFSTPHSMALDSQGDLYIADSNNHRIQKFDSRGNFILQWGGQGTAAGQFNEPWGIAVDKEGNVYVADTWNHRIEKFDANGKFLTQWGTFGDGGKEPLTSTQFYGPRAIAIDPDGNLWVTDTGNKRVLEFDPNGQSLGAFGSAGADAGQFLEPVGIAVDKQGNIYVADTWNQRIQKFDKDFNPIQQWPVEAWDGQSVVNKPYLATDADGNLYASDPEGYRIIKFSGDGKVLSVWGTRGTDLGTFDLPTGLAVGPDGKIYVADAGNSRILIFGPVNP